MIYAINICTDTTPHDRFDKVAINNYPIIVFGNRDELYKHLSTNETKMYIQNLLRTKTLYEVSVFRIREIDGYIVNEFELSIPEIVKIEF